MKTRGLLAFGRSFEQAGGLRKEKSQSRLFFYFRQTKIKIELFARAEPCLKQAFRCPFHAWNLGSPGFFGLAQENSGFCRSCAAGKKYFLAEESASAPLGFCAPRGLRTQQCLRISELSACGFFFIAAAFGFAYCFEAVYYFIGHSAKS
jgi:hypothetical protein